MRGPILITGGGGQLASDLEEALVDRGQITALSHSDLDICDDQAVEAVFERVAPRAVFNCAAFHNVDLCEREEDRAFEVNARAVKRLAERCSETGAVLVHLSTNYVFPGDRSEPYVEADRPNPHSIYAISKLAGEYAALANAREALIVRSAGLYGKQGSSSKRGNFVVRMLGRVRAQGQLQVVGDQRLSPTHTSDLAGAIVAAVEQGARGLLHLTNSGGCSWHEFTEAILALAGLEVPVEMTQTTRAPGAAIRPRNGVLASIAAREVGLQPLRHWREALEAYMARAGLAA